MERGLGSSPQTSHGPPDSVHRMAVSGTRQQAGSCRVSPDLVLEVTLHHFCCITLVTQAALATLGGTYVGGASTRECQSLGTVLKAAHTSVCTQTPRPPDIQGNKEREQKEKQRNSEKTICREQKKLKKKKELNLQGEKLIYPNRETSLGCNTNDSENHSKDLTGSPRPTFMEVRTMEQTFSLTGLCCISAFNPAKSHPEGSVCDYACFIEEALGHFSKAQSVSRKVQGLSWQFSG